MKELFQERYKITCRLADAQAKDFSQPDLLTTKEIAAITGYNRNSIFILNEICSSRNSF